MVEVGGKSVTLVAEMQELAGDCALLRAPWAIATHTHSIFIIYEF
ncbi:hypothetical protein NIES4073_65390 [Kalymmatonema gypsitolerans NIES-4073]|nr:hypothetical protein NIES4073_65390 [Scytonema sp. NIES-4073]